MIRHKIQQEEEEEEESSLDEMKASETIRTGFGFGSKILEREREGVCKERVESMKN